MKPFTVLILLISFTNSWASQSFDKDLSSAKTFRIEDRPAPSPLFTPTEWLEEGIAAFARSSTRLNLMKWLSQKDKEAPKEDYNRRYHFGTWVDDPHDQTCQNTRAKVLQRDSQSPVQFSSKNPCSVVEGTWKDPYTGFVLTRSDEVQVDHFVPLKNAYVSGGWKWSQKKRCLYANFMGNEFHLLTVQAHANMSKGDSTPEQYLPPNHAYVCQYLKNWLSVKLIWNLKMSESEANSIQEHFQNYGCSAQEFTISQNELAAQRLATEKLQVLCD